MASRRRVSTSCSEDSYSSRRPASSYSRSSSSSRSRYRRKRRRSRSRSTPTPLRERRKKEDKKKSKKTEKEKSSVERKKDKVKEKLKGKNKDSAKQKDRGDKKNRANSRETERRKEKKDKDGTCSGNANKKGAETEERTANGAPQTKGLGASALGDLLKLQSSLAQDASRLELVLLQTKREIDEARETRDKQEKREQEYYRGSFGEPLGPGNRLLLEDALGQGAFSTVYRCRDMHAKTGSDDKRYAVKFIRKNNTLRRATEREVKLMRRLRSQCSERDAEGAACFLGLTGPEVFEHEGHLALVFQLQKCDLRCGLRKYGQGKGLPLSMVRSYSRNIFMALRALRRVNVIHSDLKPENLLMSLDKASVKLSDFGSAMSAAEQMNGERAAESLQPRYYRAPEVILGQQYTTQIDVWSAGCTVFELATGKFLFTGKTNNGMLHDMLRSLGCFSSSFCKAGSLATRHFNEEDGAFRKMQDANDDANLQLLPREHFPRPAKPLMEPIDAALQSNASTDYGSVAAACLAELVASCVQPDPATRVWPETALASRFLRPSGNSQ